MDSPEESTSVFVIRKNTGPVKIKNTATVIAHFLLFFPVLGFETLFDSWSYIFGFAAGTLFAMSAFGLVIGHLSNYTSTHENQNFFKGIRLAAGLIALVVGVYWFFSV